MRDSPGWSTVPKIFSQASGQLSLTVRSAQRRSKVPLILSGGLDAHNVGAAIRAVRPFAVDTASGTEAEPGRKDPEKLEAFAEAVRAAGAELAAEAEVA